MILRHLTENLQAKTQALKPRTNNFEIQFKFQNEQEKKTIEVKEAIPLYH